MLNGDFVSVPQREQTSQGGHNRRFTIDPGFVAMTADHATAFDGDFFTRSLRMDAPMMPKTSDLKL
jgi:hypothetical protein